MKDTLSIVGASLVPVLFILAACQPQNDASVAQQCQVFLEELERQQSLVLTADQEASQVTVLDPINRWLTSWNNSYQWMTSVTRMTREETSRFQAQACNADLRAAKSRFFSNRDYYQALNELDLSKYSTSTQHFANKLRQQFHRYGVLLDDANPLPLYPETIVAGDIGQWYRQQKQLANLLGYPSALSLARSQQMLPLDAVVREYLAARRQVLEKATSRHSQEFLPLVFNWSVVRNGFARLSAILGLEWVAAQVVLPYRQNSDSESFQLFSNGQLVGELVFDLQWTGDKGDVDFLPLRRGVKGIQTSQCVIVGRFAAEVSSPQSGINTVRKQLSHADLRALLHQFGHCLHHQLAQQPWILNAGQSTEVDFAEVPALLLEQWAWSEEGLAWFKAMPTNAGVLETVKHRYWLNYDRTMLHYAEAIEQSFVIESFTNLKPAEDELAKLDLRHRHCQDKPAAAYRCLLASQLAHELIADFDRFGYDDRQTANRLKARILSLGGSRPGLDMVSHYLNKPYSLY